MEETLAQVWDAAAGLLPRDRIGLSFIEKDGERVTARACRAAYDGIRLGEGYSADLRGSTLHAILQTGRIRIIHDLAAYLEEHPDSGSTKLLRDEDLRSSITVPLRVDERAVGFLFFSSRLPDAFEARHGRLLLAVRDIIAQAVEKAWIIKRLQESNKNYLSAIGFVSHEIKSPLGALIMAGQMYLDGYKGEVTPAGRETVEKMIRTGGYLLDMVRDYLDLTRLETGEMRFEPRPGVRLKDEVIADALALVADHAERRGSTVEARLPEGEIVLTADRNLLRIVVTNLLDNAVKYGHDEITVDFQVDMTGEDTVRLRVRNAGVGFSEEQGKKLFKRFSRLKQKGLEDRRGSGLGLYLTWWIVQQHGGTITATSEPGEWAEFTVILPHAVQIEN